MDKKRLSFITVIGKDKKGIVARIANLLYRNNINIEDISQKIMEGFFVMAMLVDMADCKKDRAVFAKELKNLGEKMGLTVQIQDEEIFKRMHRI
ncbi:MAG: ACT domain-containing protein [Candidatus Omnitrophica bacterium]|nr:ACT domain-containing protein [Candidatus Omnitrophota bacterium]